MNGPDVSKVFTCSFCGNHSYWTRNTPDQGMYCLTCRCRKCIGLMAFQTAENGTLHVYCPTCIREGNETTEETVN